MSVAASDAFACVISNITNRAARTRRVVPEPAAASPLQCGRIILDAGAKT